MGYILRAGNALDLEERHAGLPLAGWLMSEKMDGQRLFWDGGVTLGMPLSTVPWMNQDWLRIHREHRNTMSSGLWSRYLNPVVCPKAVVSRLPLGVILDLEAWGGRGRFSNVMSVVRRFDATEDDWQGQGRGNGVTVRLIAHDIIPGTALFSDRTGERGAVMRHSFGDMWAAMAQNVRPGIPRAVLLAQHDQGYRFRLRALQALSSTCASLKGAAGNSSSGFRIVDPWESHSDWGWEPVVAEEVKALSDITKKFEEIKWNGGEGVMLQDPKALWVPKRVDSLLKVKATHNLIGRVVGWTPGAGKFAGMLGSLIIKPEIDEDLPPRKRVTQQFQVGTGFDDSERMLVMTPSESQIPKFYPEGTMVEIGYMDVTEDHAPREPRFLRIHVGH